MYLVGRDTLARLYLCVATTCLVGLCNIATYSIGRKAWFDCNKNADAYRYGLTARQFLY